MDSFVNFYKTLLASSILITIFLICLTLTVIFVPNSNSQCQERGYEYGRFEYNKSNTKLICYNLTEINNKEFSVNKLGKIKDG